MATLVSTGAVNLTSSTNWSPAQIPANGDNLTISDGHVLTLDADITLGTVLIGAGGASTAGITISGSRTVTATLWDFRTGRSNFFGTIVAGQTVVLYGRWVIPSGGGPANQVFLNQTGGSVTLSTIGGDQTAELFQITATAFRITGTWTGSGTLTTVGRFTTNGTSFSSQFVTMSAGTWTHASIGQNVFKSGTHQLAYLTGTAVVNWTGSITSESSIAGSLNASAGLFMMASSGTHTIGQSGDAIRLTNATVSGNSWTPMVWCQSGIVELAGSFSCLGSGIVAVQAYSGTVRYRNQSISVPSTDTLWLYVAVGSLDLSGLVISNAGKVVVTCHGSGTVTASAGTSITCTSTAAHAVAVGTTALDGKIVTLASDPPTLPAVSDVASGTVYGYTASPLTGTGIVNDPADIAAAVGTALESMSATALRRFVTVNTGETAATSGSVADLSGGGGSSGLTADQWTALRAILGVPATGTTPDDPTTGILDTIRDFASSADGKLTTPRLAKIDNLLGSGTYSTLTAAQVEAALLNDADGQALLDAISVKVQTLFDGGADVPVATLVSLIAAQVTTDHGSGSYVRNTEPDNSGIASAKTAAESADGKITAGRLTRIDALPTATAGTAGGLALHGETGGGGAGDASQTTLLAVQDTVEELAAALVGAESIVLTGPVTGTDISIVIDSDYRQRSGTELPIPVDDSTGALSTRLNALGLDNLSFGAAREGKAAGEITGTVYSVTNAAGVTTIRVEISNAGSGLSPGEYAWQLQASHTQGDEVDNEIVISGNLILERRTVAPL